MATASAMPRRVRDTIAEINRDSALNAGLKVAAERKDELGPMPAKLAGIANHPAAREHWEARLDEHFRAGPSALDADELVIGAGLHAAIYASVRVASGHPRPLLVDRGRPGGTFASGPQPAFYLNSRNRPGGLGNPGDRLAQLNAVPGAPLQPADLSASEYQRDSDLGFVVRAALAMHADVIGWNGVENVSYALGTLKAGERRFAARLQDGRTVAADRIVVATGIGDPVTWGRDSERIVTFAGLMQRIAGDHWPLRGLRRVAVIGAGDSGRCAVEALTGQGPAAGWSPASLDYVERIDWYGLAQANRAEWEKCNRSRYKGIGRLLPADEKGGFGRLVPQKRATFVSGGFGVAYVDGDPYDLVVDCRGFERDVDFPIPLRDDDEDLFEDDDPWDFQEFNVDNRRLGLRSTQREAFVVGPASGLRESPAEKLALPDGIPENGTALFRYAGRTAQLAATLPGIVRRRARQAAARKPKAKRPPKGKAKPAITTASTAAQAADAFLNAASFSNEPIIRFDTTDVSATFKAEYSTTANPFLSAPTPVPDPPDVARGTGNPLAGAADCAGVQLRVGDKVVTVEGATYGEVVGSDGKFVLLDALEPDGVTADRRSTGAVSPATGRRTFRTLASNCRLAGTGPELGRDMAGGPLRVGDLVDTTGFVAVPVLGRVDGSDQLIGVGGRALQSSASYRTGGRLVFGVYPSSCRLSRAADPPVAGYGPPLGAARDGRPIYRGSRVRRTGGDQQDGVILGRAQTPSTGEDVPGVLGLFVLKANGEDVGGRGSSLLGGYRFDGVRVWGVRPDEVELVGDGVPAYIDNDRNGNRLYAGARVASRGDTDDGDGYPVEGFAIGLADTTLGGTVDPPRTVAFVYSKRGERVPVPAEGLTESSGNFLLGGRKLWGLRASKAWEVVG